MGWTDSHTTVTNQPNPQTPAELEADRLRLEEMRRQNDLAAQMLPGQMALIEQQRRLIQYQMDHAGDLDEIHSAQLRLANMQIQQQIADAAMQEQLRPQQLEFLQTQNRLAMSQLDMLSESTAFQREQNQYTLAALRDQQARIDARNRHWTPEQEAIAAAEEAGRAQRMGGMSEEAARIQLENLRRGNKPTDEQLANINEAFDASQARGESDITRYLQQTLRQINEETAQASGLLPTDTPITRLSERAGEEAARAQGNLTESIAQGRATARLNYPLAANQLEGTQAATLQGLTSQAANFQDQLRLAAQSNRNTAFNAPGGVGFAMPQSGPGSNLSFMNGGQAGYNPNAFGFNFNRGGNSSGTSGSGSMLGSLGGIGSLASGIGGAMSGYSALAGGATAGAGAFAGGVAGAEAGAAGAASFLPWLASIFSDARLKEDIERIGETDSGVSIFRYRYKGDPVPRMGVMAQDVMHVFPDAVHKDSSGFLKVDYSKVH